MHSTSAKINRLMKHSGPGKWLALLSLALVVSLLVGSRSFAQDQPTTAEVAQVIESEQLLAAQPAGLAYVAAGDAFVVLDAAVQGAAGFDAYTLYEPATNVARPLAGGPAIDSPLNMTYDAGSERLLLFNGAAGELMAALLTGSDAAGLAVTDRYDLSSLGLQGAAGMAVDSAGAALYILDSAAQRVVRIAPGSDGSYAGAAAQAEGRVSAFDLAALGAGVFRGLAFNPANGHLYVMAPARAALYELTPEGQLVKTHDLRDRGLIGPQAIVFAPSGDQTDDPNQYDLYVADSGQAQDASADPWAASNRVYLPLLQGTEAQAGAADAANADAPAATTVVLGKVVEIALDQPLAQVAAAVDTIALSLVRTVQTWQWSPSSPDPSGIAYLPSANRLVISDGEVDEIARLFTTKKNVFISSLSGSLQGTMSTIAYSKEPTGASYNPADGHLFYSDDSKRVIFEIAPGSDGDLGTTDDVVTSFSVSPFGGRDPEDVNYDVTNRALWIIDGLNAEVYHVRPGANNKFDGIAPDGDDVLTQFDTRKLGILDPEGIYRDPESGNLFLTSSSTTRLWEVSTSGVLLRQYDVSAANAKKLAGITMAPGSNNAGVTNIYLVDRMVDNDTNSSENDGRMYEFTRGSAPPATGTPTPTATSPAVTATPTHTPTPTNTPQPGAVKTFSPVGDTYVRSDWPNSNYSGNADLRAVGGSNSINTYLKFDVSGLSGAAQSAKLRLYVTDASPSGGSIYLVSNNYANTSTPWVESNLRFNNAPPISGSPLSTLGSVAVGNWVEFDVTAAITGNDTYSFGVASTSSNSVFYSSNNAAANKPLLVITE